MHQRHRRRNHSPDHHQRGNPSPRANPLQHQIARHLEQKIPNEKNSGSQPVHPVAQLQLFLHLHRRKSHVDAIQIGHHIQQQQKRQQPPAQFRKQRLLVEVDASAHPFSSFSRRITSSTISSGDFFTLTVIASVGSSSVANWSSRILTPAKCPCRSRIRSAITSFDPF